MKKDLLACDEYNRLSRRRFISGSAKAGAVAALMPSWLPRLSFASSQNSSRDVIISIFLRGGMDGLSSLVPYGDPFYYKGRPTIAVPRADSKDPNHAIDLDGFFGLPPAMKPLLDAYKAGHLLPIHATGGVPNDWTRSHFDAQHWMEVGKPADSSISTGWLGRHLATAPPMNATAPLRALGLTYGLPTSLAGGDKTLPIPDPANFGFEGSYDSLPEMVTRIMYAYQYTIDPVRAAANVTQQTINLLHKINFQTYKPAGGAIYPQTDFGNAMSASAAIMRAQIGVEAIAIDLGGWDTHGGEGPVGGYMAGLMADLAGSLAAFHADMNAAGTMGFTLVVMSEFGRTAAENVNQGTDHGTANAMFLMGGSIAGGRVLSKWPGLAPEQQQDGQDLKITIDYRDILSEIVAKRLDNAANLGAVFPQYTPTFQGVTK